MKFLLLDEKSEKETRVKKELAKFYFTKKLELFLSLIENKKQRFHYEGKVINHLLAFLTQEWHEETMRTRERNTFG